MPADTTLPVIQMRVEGKIGTYDVEASCHNCGSHYMLRLSRGIQAPRYRADGAGSTPPECPNCGLREVYR